MVPHMAVSIHCVSFFRWHIILLGSGMEGLGLGRANCSELGGGHPQFY